MGTLSISKVGIIDRSKALQRRFEGKYLDYKRETESALVHALFRQGNSALAVLHANRTVDKLINEQMYLKTIE